MTTPTYTNLEHLGQYFIKFADRECGAISKIYYYLSNKVALDQELLQIAAYCQPRQPIPNLFFGAIHYLLLKKPNCALAQYYPTIFPEQGPLPPFELFKSFCLNHHTQIIDLVQSRIVQTNAINRCAVLMPVIAHLYGGKAINFIDLGTSAGLNLFFDQYEYHYNNHKVWGESPVKINANINSSQMPSFQKMPFVHHRIGIDQNPIDLSQEDHQIWLKALIWPDHLSRFQRMETALKHLDLTDAQLIKAQSISAFRAIIDQLDSTIPLVIAHSHVLYQFTPKEREAFWNMLDELGQQRDFSYIAVEASSILRTAPSTKGVFVELHQYQCGQKSAKIIAETDGHANWVKWN